MIETTNSNRTLKVKPKRNRNETPQTWRASNSALRSRGPLFVLRLCLVCTRQHSPDVVECLGLESQIERADCGG